jgi:hypothetical protein
MLKLNPTKRSTIQSARAVSPGLGKAAMLLLLVPVTAVLQAECLNQPAVLDGCNLVYCAPTNGGKSLVAEILMLLRLIKTGRPALLVRVRCC